MTISVGHGKGKASQLQTSRSSHVFCFTEYKLLKTDPESSNYLRYRRRNVFPDCDCFCPPFWKRGAADNLSRMRNVHDFWQSIWAEYMKFVYLNCGLKRIFSFFYEDHTLKIYVTNLSPKMHQTMTLNSILSGQWFPMWLCPSNKVCFL